MSSDNTPNRNQANDQNGKSDETHSTYERILKDVSEGSIPKLPRVDTGKEPPENLTQN